METRDLVLAPALSDRNTDYQLAWHEAAEEYVGGAPLSVLETRPEWMSDPTLAQSIPHLVSRAELDGYRDYILSERNAQYDDCVAELEGTVLR
ncbi:hypothetical protein AB0M58_13940 [Streptomyces bobili]|uniref:hypothetical protein n=1 Tax=Streptomyces bobili TaxID=67280 RepID=UPI00343C0797